MDQQLLIRLSQTRESFARESERARRLSREAVALAERFIRTQFQHSKPKIVGWEPVSIEAGALGIHAPSAPPSRGADISQIPLVDVKFAELLDRLQSPVLHPDTAGPANLEPLLREFARVLEVDAITFLTRDSSDGSLLVTNSVGLAANQPIIQRLNASRQLPWSVKMWGTGRPIVHSRRPVQLPREAWQERLVEEKTRTKSTLNVPIMHEGELRAVISGATVFRFREWSDQDLLSFRMIGSTLEHAAQLRRSKSELMQLRNDLKWAARAETNAKISASIAHELNQPLGTILNNAQAARRLLNSENPRLQEVRTALDDIITDDKRAADLVRNVRNLFRPGDRPDTILEVPTLFTEVERLTHSNARAKQASLEIEISRPLASIRGDQTQLIQAILNLVLNALDAVSQNRNRPAEVVLHACGRTEGAVHIAVRDNGSGIDPQTAPHLFEAFFTTKPEGLGMGLAIAHSVVERHGGNLTARSNRNGGSVFEFDLPGILN